MDSHSGKLTWVDDGEIGEFVGYIDNIKSSPVIL